VGKKTPQAPTPPDPTVVANAQSAANIASATAQQKLNMIGTSGPTGTTGYVADPNQPGGYTQNTTLSPGQQGIYDSGVQAQQGALNVANQQIGRVGDALSAGLTSPHLQTSYDSGGPIQSSFNHGGALQYGYDPGQQVQGHAGYQNINASVNQAANAAYGQATSRLDPQWKLAQQEQESKLANQGLGQNSTAYQSGMDTFNRGKNDAYNQAAYSAINAGNQEQNTLMGQQLAQGTFANQAAAQMYGQNQGQAAFNNAAAGQDYGQNMGAAQFANSAQAQQNNENQAAATFGNQAMGQQFQNDAYAQSLPINEFNSLMSSGQVATPQGVQYTPSQVGQTDVTGAYALNSQAQQANYKAAMDNNASNMGGLFKLGSSLLMAPMTGGGSLAGNFLSSDIRLKKDIRRVGALDDGTPVYSYRYKAGGPPMIGVMAHELAQSRPDAVREIGGYLAVNYGAL
jgi:hypothetical protein